MNTKADTAATSGLERAEKRRRAQLVVVEREKTKGARQQLDFLVQYATSYASQFQTFTAKKGTGWLYGQHKPEQYEEVKTVEAPAGQDVVQVPDHGFCTIDDNEEDPWSGLRLDDPE